MTLCKDDMVVLFGLRVFATLSSLCFWGVTFSALLLADAAFFGPLGSFFLAFLGLLFFQSQYFLEHILNLRAIANFMADKKRCFQCLIFPMDVIEDNQNFRQIIELQVHSKLCETCIGRYILYSVMHLKRLV